MIQDTKTYTTIEDIMAERNRLHEAMIQKGDEIASLWDDLVHPKQDDSSSPTQKLLQYANAGAGVVDGVLLGWKLYRRLGVTLSLFRRKKKK